MGNELIPFQERHRDAQDFLKDGPTKGKKGNLIKNLDRNNNPEEKGINWKSA